MRATLRSRPASKLICCCAFSFTSRRNPRLCKQRVHAALVLDLVDIRQFLLFSQWIHTGARLFTRRPGGQRQKILGHALCQNLSTLSGYADFGYSECCFGPNRSFLWSSKDHISDGKKLFVSFADAAGMVSIHASNRWGKLVALR